MIRISDVGCYWRRELKATRSLGGDLNGKVSNGDSPNAGQERLDERRWTRLKGEAQTMRTKKFMLVGTMAAMMTVAASPALADNTANVDQSQTATSNQEIVNETSGGDGGKGGDGGSATTENSQTATATFGDQNATVTQTSDDDDDAVEDDDGADDGTGGGAADPGVTDPVEGVVVE